MTDWYNMTSNEVIKKLNSDKDSGLNNSQVEKLKSENNQEEILRKMENADTMDMIRNEIKKPWFLSAFVNILVLIIFCREYIAGFICIAALLFSLILPIFKNIKYRKNFNEIKELFPPYAHVVRNGRIIKISPYDLVKGDIVYIEKGEIVPADLRIIESKELEAKETAVTGEVYSVEKYEAMIEEEELTLSEMNNILFQTSVITKGEAKGIVIAGGLETQFGNVLKIIANGMENKPIFQQKLAEVFKKITIASIAVEILLFCISLVLTGDIYKSLYSALLGAVASVPEGMITALTCLSLIVIKLEQNKKIKISDLSVIESMAGVNTLFTDKMGVISEYKVNINCIYTDGILKNVSSGSITTDDNIERLLNCAVLCNDYNVNLKYNFSTLTQLIDKELVEFCKSFNMEKTDLERKHRRIFSIGYDSQKRIFTSINKADNFYRAYSKGSINKLLPKCTAIMKEGIDKQISDEDIQDINNISMQLESKGLIPIGLAFRNFIYEPSKKENIESNLTFIGIIAFENPIRNEAFNLYGDLGSLHVNTVVFTEDNKLVAAAFGKKLKLISRNDQILSGVELENIEDDELNRIVNKIGIFSKLNSHSKLRVIELYKKLNFSSALLSNKLYDLPCLHASDVSISAGNAVSSIVRKLTGIWLEESNTEKLRSLVEDCRKIMNTVNKVFLYIFCCIWIQLFFILASSILKLNYFINPVELLWINIVSVPVCCIGVACQYNEETSVYMDIDMPAKNSFRKSLKISFILMLLYAIYIYIINTDYKSISNFINFSVLNLSTIVLAASFSNNTFYRNAATNIILLGNLLVQVLVLFISAGFLYVSTAILYTVWYKIAFMVVIEFTVLTLVKLYKKI